MRRESGGAAVVLRTMNSVGSDHHGAWCGRSSVSSNSLAAQTACSHAAT